MPARKRVNRTDLTLRNLHALKKLVKALQARVARLEAAAYLEK